MAPAGGQGLGRTNPPSYIRATSQEPEPFMLYANTTDNQKITATPKTVACCPFCNSQLIPKCGPIKTWHWAHKTDAQCDTWSEGESEWHLQWKLNFPKENTEVLIKNPILKEVHIADYYNKVSFVTVEFQKSSLSLYDRIIREAFYKNLHWVIYTNWNNLEYYGSGFGRRGFFYFWWKHPKLWVTTKQNASCNYYLDMGSTTLFNIKKVRLWKTRTYIEGVFVDKTTFIKNLNSNV